MKTTPDVSSRKGQVVVEIPISNLDASVKSLLPRSQNLQLAVSISNLSCS